MKFDTLKKNLASLKQSLHQETGRNLIDEITVVEPCGDRSELDFLNLVTWCYVLIYEAGTTLLQQLGALARSSDPHVSNDIMHVRADVQNIRTSRFHNLPSTSKSNEHKKRQAAIWLQTNGGDPIDWGICCDELCGQMLAYVDLIRRHWAAAISKDEDKDQVVIQLLDALEKKWPAHEYDRIVEEIADELQIKDLDVVAYRNDNLNDWQRITRYFANPDSARIAIRTVIHNGLVDSFRPRQNF